jgi:hypothetical protein
MTAAPARRDCFKKCKQCLTRRIPDVTSGVCGESGDLQCCGGPGEPVCCGGPACCGAGERCCSSESDPALPSRCVDVQSDPDNCGICNQVCALDQTCSAGACVEAAACPPDRTSCGSPDNTAGNINACCDAGQLCCPLAQAAWLCSPAGNKCCDFPSLVAPGVVQFPCPSDHTCCGNIPPGGTETVVGCCPPGYGCGVDGNGAAECQLQ